MLDAPKLPCATSSSYTPTKSPISSASLPFASRAFAAARHSLPRPSFLFTATSHFRCSSIVSTLPSALSFAKQSASAARSPSVIAPVASSTISGCRVGA